MQGISFFKKYFNTMRSSIFISFFALLLLFLSQPAYAEPTFRNESEALSSLNLHREYVTTVVSGRSLKLEVLSDGKNRFFSPDSFSGRELLRCLGTEVSNYGRTFKSRLSTVTIEDGRILSSEKNISMVPQEFTIRRRVWIPLKYLQDLTSSPVAIKGATLWIDPVLQSIDAIDEPSGSLIKIVSNADIVSKTMQLKNPDRFIVDLKNMQLSKEQLSLPRRELPLKQNLLLTYAQNSSCPNIVRIVVPIPNGGSVYPLKGKNRNELLIRMRTSALSTQISTPASVPRPTIVTHSPTVTTPFSEQVAMPPVYNMLQNREQIVISASGPVKYEFRRYADKISVDLLNTMLQGKGETRNVDSPMVASIRTAQFAPRPNPISRFVVDLKPDASVEVASPRDDNRIILTIIPSTKYNVSLPRTGSGLTFLPKKDKLICIDPGHGGSDSGALNRVYNVSEKELTIKIASRISAILQKRGWKTVMTRYSDCDVSYAGSGDTEELQARVDVAAKTNSDIFISIHCDASANSEVRGYSIHWYKEMDRALATSIHSSMDGLIPSRDRGTRNNNFYVLSANKIPSVLFETGFITNAADLKHLSQPDGIERIATGVANGIEEYFKAIFCSNN